MTNQTAAENLQVIDSLVANEFAVEIDGQPATGIFRVSGLVSYQLDDAQQRVHVPITIAKMVQRDGNNPFNKWIRETVNEKIEQNRPRRTLEIVAIDDGTEIRRWKLNGAKINGISYSDFDSASGEMVEERLMIEYESIEESWPAAF